MRGAPRYWFPQTLIRRDVLGRMLLVGAASAACERPCSPRCWDGFGESSPLRTSTSIHLSVHFFRDNEPTSSLAVWACVAPPSVMQHAVLLGRDSWMRFNTRSYRAMTPRPHDNRVSASWRYPATPRQACQLMPLCRPPCSRHQDTHTTDLIPHGNTAAFFFFFQLCVPVTIFCQVSL